MPMLGGRCVLHGADIEKVARRAMNDGVRMFRIQWLDERDREELLSYLIAAGYELSLKWNPDHPRASRRFADHAGFILPRRVASWYRAERRHVRIDTFSFDQFQFAQDRDDAEAGGLERALAAREGDPHADRDTSLRGLVDGRDRGASWAAATLGVSPPTRARRRARAA